jgi:hypothetical protein
VLVEVRGPTVVEPTAGTGVDDVPVLRTRLDEQPVVLHEIVELPPEETLDGLADRALMTHVPELSTVI